MTSQEAGPVLQRYIRIASATRPYFQAGMNDPVDSFIAEAEHHPDVRAHPGGRSPIGPGPGNVIHRRAPVRCVFTAVVREQG